MKTLIFLALFLPSVCYPSDTNGVEFSPSFTFSLGTELRLGLDRSNYASAFLNSFLFKTQKSGVGAKFLGLGASVNDHGEASPIISPIAYCFNPLCVVPSFVFPPDNQPTGGVSIGIQF